MRSTLEGAATLELPTELWIKVFAYLSIGDLQQARLVCRNWRNIADLPDFLCRAKLNITKHNLHSIRERIQSAATAGDVLLKVRHLELHDVRCTDELQPVLETIGKDVRSLTLHTAVPRGCINGRMLPKLQQMHINELSSVIDTDDVEGTETAAVAGDVLDDAWQQLNLNSFPLLDSLGLIRSIDERQQQHCVLQQLKCDNSNLQLRQLSLKHQRVYEEMLLLQVLEAHAPTLSHLNLHLVCRPRLHIRWSHLFQQLHRLESLSLCGKCRTEWLDTIFRSIPETAPLRHVDFNGLLDASDSLLQLMAQKWPAMLQHLEFMFCVQLTDAGVMWLGQSRSNLRVLDLAFCRHVTSRGLLKGIASQCNPVLRELHLGDLQKLDEHCICALAERLPNLEALSLNNCNDAVTDRALAHIFCHQTRIQTLNLDDCSLITDVGFMGCPEAPYSIRRLRGLRTLSVRNCRKLTNYTLHALQFQELRTLQLGYCRRISTVGIAALVVNCPTLENLAISCCMMLDDESILHITQGLRRLRRLNVSNCLNITERAIDYIVSMCTSLQELTMCGMDTWEVCDVQQRLLQVKPQLKELHL